MMPTVKMIVNLIPLLNNCVHQNIVFVIIDQNFVSTFISSICSYAKINFLFRFFFLIPSCFYKLVSLFFHLFTPRNSHCEYFSCLWINVYIYQQCFNLLVCFQDMLWLAIILFHCVIFTNINSSYLIIYIISVPLMKDEGKKIRSIRFCDELLHDFFQKYHHAIQPDAICTSNSNQFVTHISVFNLLFELFATSVLIFLWLIKILVCCTRYTWL